MNVFLYLSLFFLGTLFGSFGSVIINRLKTSEGGILSGRSHCFKCNTILKFIDLFPIFSFVSSLGKCRYCKAKIPNIYPLIEISTGLIFVLIGIFLIDMNSIISFQISEIIKLFYWLIIGFISILYIFYDILFYEIHEGIMLTGIVFAFIGLIINTFFINLIPSIYFNIPFDLVIGISSIFIGIVIIIGLYIIMLKELSTIYDIAILIGSIILIFSFKNFFIINDLSQVPIISGIVGALGIFIFFYLQILLSNGKALGGGDLRIGIMVGLLLGISYSFVGMLLTYLIGSIISILIIFIKKIKNKNKKLNTIVPFGPFIGIGFFVTIFLLNDIKKFIEIYFSIL